MKTKVIKSSELDINCWSPMRYLDGCHMCWRVHKCKLLPAKEGRARIARMRVHILKQQLLEAERTLKSISEE